MSPGHAFQVVQVPTWLWLARSSWRPVSESAAVGGVSVTATARPRRAVWSMGDGSSVICEGPGTPYSARTDGMEPSPDCGYTYRSASGGRFLVTVRVIWDVFWKGAGEVGVVPGLSVSANQRVAVREVQTIVMR
ncbi:hypothetical protein E0L36_02255 [Streptomyces sp. AJS327]|nr:hypothetical protein [Streptomyces sp. AJS327]